MVELTERAAGLKFPEGPVACADGSVILVEIAIGRLTRVGVDGTLSTIAELGGGPNGAAIGPDGRCYVCNNGGMPFHEKDGSIFPGLAEDNAASGWIEAVDLTTGESEVLYRDCDGDALLGPNDIVFDRDGGFWFTDHGKTRMKSRDRGGGLLRPRRWLAHRARHRAARRAQRDRPVTGRRPALRRRNTDRPALGL